MLTGVLLVALIACGRVGGRTADGEPATSTPGAAGTPDAPGVATSQLVPADIIVILENGLRSDLGNEKGAEAAFFDGIEQKPLAVYSQATVQSVNPFLSIGSMLTGRYPSAIPLCSQPTLKAGAEPIWCMRFPATVPTLPEVLGVYGYQTLLATTQPHAREHAVLAEEFGTTIVGGTGVDGLAGLVDQVSQWWIAAAGQPRFVVLADDMVVGLAAVAAPHNNPDERPKLLEAYKAAAGSRGKVLARAVRAFSDVPPSRSTWVFVTAAHGVSLLETSGTPNMPLQPVQHDILLDRTLHVPLAVYGTESVHVASETNEVTEGVDLFPTIARLANVMAPVGLAGADLLDPATFRGEPRYGYAEFGDMLAIRSRTHLLMARLWMHGGTALDPEITTRLMQRSRLGSTFALHDVSTDPMQHHDVVKADEATARTLYAALAQRRTGPGSPPDRGLTEAQVAALRASGALNYW